MFCFTLRKRARKRKSSDDYHILGGILFLFIVGL